MSKTEAFSNSGLSTRILKIACDLEDFSFIKVLLVFLFLKMTCKTSSKSEIEVISNFFNFYTVFPVVFINFNLLVVFSSSSKSKTLFM